jgi:hypothetical protein
MLIMMTSSAPAGQLYTWIDGKGIAHITDQPPDEPAKMIDKQSFKTEQNQQISSIIQKLEDDHLKVVERAEETYRKEIADIELRQSKQMEEIRKLKMDVIKEYNEAKAKEKMGPRE